MYELTLFVRKEYDDYQIPYLMDLCISSMR